ncbi:MAG: hypothetical protein A2900_06155 [Candidatus Chisholmbacteria bacterium RIFCSPLOWO2_01_FULL_50_28]|uniref:Uncharacterized protein n=1 Tax=Candidatus Chisholmbacteria bacterium RIFCSPHIGHO2_01_FULL_52_32 TaxID=1797591 RepID=A0A1G1VQW7_9BACT|nr:MAG: hypothetical protein A2786_00530 [Candidatus Chisholmbacteria bacterium RIFCSPHIGHO2_01_FULL_52_32]OGY20696.1 MAG: hypothetical protein A2900_06155 [Candidatus Chisholmbacteria bacterium RIFCSPLOWO2_01_FULL_50_28]
MVMAQVAQAELPRTGFGSEPWFGKIFNFDHELRRTQEVIDRVGIAIGVPAVLESLRAKSRALLSEYGVGERALTVQPLTRYVMRNIDGAWGVYAYQLDEYGEQLESYLDFDQYPEAVGEGLKKAFSTLVDSEVGEGVVIISPTELYAKYDSKGNVINPLVVVDKRDCEVEVAGWFLFVDRRLSNRERAFLLNIHTLGVDFGIDALDSHTQDAMMTRLSDMDDVIVESPIFPEWLVRTPRSFRFPAEVAELKRLPKSPSTAGEYVHVHSVLAPYLAALDGLFRQRFGRYLFEFDAEGEREQEERVCTLIRDNAQGLLGLLLKEDKRAFLKTLWGMLSFGQRQWAKEKGRDVDRYMDALLSGEIQIAGFHPSTREDTGQYWDPITQSWIGGEDACGSENGKKRCERCREEYTGNSCPRCERVQS